MKIVSAEVHDPRRQGMIARPRIIVNVDTAPEATQPAVEGADGWRSMKYGSLVRYAAGTLPDDAGHYNVAFRDILEPIVDVEVFRLDTESDVEGKWALTIKRAREELRRHDPEWRLAVNDHDAQEGRVVWTPFNRVRPTRCLFWTNRSGGLSGCCDMPAQQNILMPGRGRVEYPMCRRHAEYVNRLNANGRKVRNG
jgi:hypothetical protein